MSALSRATITELEKKAAAGVQVAAAGAVARTSSAPTPATSTTLKPESGGSSQSAVTPSSTQDRKPPPVYSGAADSTESSRSPAVTTSPSMPTLPVPIPSSSLGGQSVGTGEGNHTCTEREQTRAATTGQQRRTGLTLLVGVFVCQCVDRLKETIAGEECAVLCI